MNINRNIEKLEKSQKAYNYFTIFRMNIEGNKWMSFPFQGIQDKHRWISIDHALGFSQFTYQFRCIEIL